MKTKGDAPAAADRYGYRPQRQRGAALALTGLVFSMPLVLLAVLSWQPARDAVPPAAHVAVFDVPAEQPVDVPEPDLPEPEAEVPTPAQPQAVQPMAAPPAASLVLAAAPAPAPTTVDPGPAPAASAAPPPPARPRKSGGEQGPDTWHARVLARLNAAKRYPASARARRQQGTVTIRFVLDRKGNVLDTQMLEGSGFALLDREALALPRRTSPLPPPPESKAGERVELVVPVEFYF